MNTLIKAVTGVILALSAFSQARQTSSGIQEDTLLIFNLKENTEEILTLAEKNLTIKLVSKVLGGGENYDKISSQVERKIFPQRKKFILLTKILNTKKFEEIEEEKKKALKEEHQNKNLEDGFTAEVFVRYSPATLKKILLQENLFYLDQGFNRILSFIEFKDAENNQTYKWWVNDPPPKDKAFTRAVNEFYSSAQTLFMPYGFYFIHPIFNQYGPMLKGRLRYNKAAPERAKRMAKFFSAYLIMIGSISLSQTSGGAYQALWDVSLYDSVHLRKLAEHKARVKTPQSSWGFLKQHTDYWVKNFALELSSIYKKGALSTRLFKIEVRGFLSFLDRKKIKDSLARELSSVKNLIETAINADSIQYSADVNTGNDDLIEKIKSIEVPGFKLSPYLKSKNYIVIRVKTK